MDQNENLQSLRNLLKTLDSFLEDTLEHPATEKEAEKLRNKINKYLPASLELVNLSDGGILPTEWEKK